MSVENMNKGEESSKSKPGSCCNEPVNADGTTSQEYFAVRPVDVIDLTSPSTSHALVDLTQDYSPVQVIYETSGRPRRSKRKLRITEEIQNVQIVDNDLDSDELPEMLPNIRASATTAQEKRPIASPSQRIQCPICLDSHSQITRDNRQLMSTTCGHVFCDQCIKEYLRTSKKCPSCRKTLTQKRIHPLYL